MPISKELKKNYSRRQHQESKEAWKDFFMMFCECIIDSDARDEILQEKVKTASILADVALEEAEKRWME